MEPSPHPPGADSQQAPTRTLEQLFRAMESPLLAYAMRLTRQADAAQDCVQEAFLRLHPRLAAGEIREPSAWLYRTVHNLAITRHRETRRAVPFESPASVQHSSANDPQSESHLSPAATLADPAPLPDAELERLEACGLARLVIARLDARSREVITLKFYDNLSYKDIATRTGLTVGNIGYILHHALKTLALELNRTGVTD